MKIRLKTVTPLWTGGVDQSCDRLHETNLIGSLRWWYEALVRGLGGYACDPTGEDRCPDKEGKRCAVCELFGCTGWARKFRLQVVDDQGELAYDPLKADMDFTLCFIELRPMTDAEKWLLAKALQIVSQYGSLGGKTTLKPQKDLEKGADYGIIRWHMAESVPTVNIQQARIYLKQAHREVIQDDFPDLCWFFFIQGAFLWRKQINAIIGLSEDGKRVIEDKPYQEFLRGRRGDHINPAMSKGLFSFRADSGRIWAGVVQFEV